MQQYIKYGKENAINGQWVQELENAYRKSTHKQTGIAEATDAAVCEVMFGNQLDSVDAILRNVYLGGIFP